ncbi:MAG: G1 family glutamic endopeptidase, partial [Streptosporangiaceae bacterium]
PGAAIGPGPGRPLAVRPVLAAGRRGTGIRPAEASADSLNSAGYAASRGGTRFRLVRATFFVPYLNCALSKGAFSDEWVGLGGFVGKSVTVQQDGIQANCDSAGRASYRAWHDMYPNRLVLSGLRIRAGDSVTASVFYDAATNQFKLSLTDNTTGGRFAISRGCPAGRTCPGQSAEIISSAPTRGSGRHLVVKPLADYGAVSYAAIAITDRSGQRSGLRSAFWGATRIIQTEGSAPFRVVSRPTQIQASTFDTYWSREN